jgi:hypothetical protein
MKDKVLSLSAELIQGYLIYDKVSWTLGKMKGYR